MTESPETPTRQALPTPLVVRLSELRFRLRRNDAALSLGTLLIALLAGVFLVFVADRVFDFPAWCRLAILAAVLFFVLRRLGKFVKNLNALRGNPAITAFVTARDPVTGDQIHSVLDLVQGESFSGSEELRQAAVNRLGQQVGEKDLTTLVETDPVRRVARWALILGFGSLAICLIAPNAYWNAWGRLLLPLGSLDRYTFTQIEGLAEDRVVPLGEPWDLTFRLGEESRWRPTKAQVTLGQDDPVVATIDGERFQLSFPPADHNGETLYVRVGDFSKKIQLHPKPRPGIVRASAAVQYPDYLERPEEVIDLSRGQVRPVIGSSLRVSVEASERLADIRTEGGPPARIVGNGQQVQFDRWQAGETPVRISLSLTDIHGLAREEAYVLTIEPKEDEAPTVSLEEISTNLRLIEGEATAVSIRGSDDYGLKEIGLVCSPDAEFRGSEVPLNFTQVLREGASQSRELKATTPFSPGAEGLQAGRYLLRAYALDYKPGRKPTYSSPVRLEIMSRAEHAEMVRKSFNRLQEDLEDAARQEESLYQENQRLAGEEVTPDLATPLEKQEAAERASAERIKALADRGQGLFEEALKNRDMNSSAMASWSQMVAGLQGVSQTGMPAVAEALGEAAAASSGGAASAGGSAGQAMESALSEQKKVMEELAKAMDQGAATGQMLEAGTFVNRLRSAAGRQREIADGLQTTFGQSMGLTPAELSPSLRVGLAEAADDHEANAGEIREIEKDLGHFHHRSGAPVYEQVRALMEASGIHGVLPTLTKTIGRNQLALTIPPVRHWADRLDEWAGLLSPEEEAGESSSGAEGPMADVTLMMKLMHLVQDEMRIRDQTRLLDAEREADPRYAEKSRRLGSEQSRLSATVGEIMANYGHPSLQQILRQATRAMSDSFEGLNRPDTGGATIAAQTEVIELLGQAAKNQGAAASDSEAVDALVDAMTKMAIGNNPGGNQQGQGFRGETGDVAQGSDGDGGPGAEERDVDRVQGTPTDDIPEEFREDLTQYFERMEALLSEERQGNSSDTP